jgi:hypothetical protein
VTTTEFPAGGQHLAGLRSRVLKALVALSGVLVIAWVVDAWCFLGAFGSEEAQVAGLAAAVCWLSSGMALGVSFFGAVIGRAIAGALGGIIFRTGLPLLAMAVGFQIPWLARNGFPGRIVTYFLVSLTAETILAVWLARHSWNIRFWR